ncbi:MAG: glutamine--fructose-6-phosphate transaminase (isomerizing), partial [Synergistaceae bacterium]|nr:glutamine--fructose-6-phosphate transaminase (isomerizing) [Synergistaceae bacterium]
MCGIMGYLGPRDVTEVVIGGLECLEYRGYDSAGIAVSDGRRIEISKCVGSVANLKAQIGERSLQGRVGIGHTRWATHGGVTRENAHPHADSQGRVVLIHNGIVENFYELREELKKQGVEFASETDTEVAVCLMATLYEGDPLAAIRKACARLTGAFAFVILFTDVPDRFYCVRKGPPLVLGTVPGEAFCASDVAGLLPYTNHILFMEDDEIAELSAGRIALYGFDGTPRDVRLSTVDWDTSMTSKGMYPHFMLKEIEEQGSVLRRTLAGRLDGGVDLSAEFPFSDEDVRRYRRIHLVACGTSHYASTVAGRLMDQFTGWDVRAEMASEDRYGHMIRDAETLAIFISQSGETADTLAAARLARSQGARCLAVTNMAHSSLAREVGAVLELRAGPEIGVAATKTFMGQLAALT